MASEPGHLPDGSGPLFYAHSANVKGAWDPLPKHLRAVATLAARNAARFDAEEEARLAGLLHDLGKYGDAFQRRLHGKEHHIDHWSVGGYAALMRCKQQGVAAALAIQGHHLGLCKGGEDSLRELDPKWLAERHPRGLTLSERDTELLLRRFEQDGLSLPDLDRSIAEWQSKHASFMLDVRMLYSALVDADFLATEEHFETVSRHPAPPLEPGKALAVLQRHLDELGKTTLAAESVLRLRADLLDACLQAAEQPQRLYTLSAPTGSGKTLSMLAFALNHAVRHSLDRVIVVIPYLTIIDQTADIYRKILCPHFGESYVLEHHSLAGTRKEDRDAARPGCDNEDESVRAARLASENWDAPIVVTTSVQFLESLFANRPSACRKLHRIARSIVLFDEVQTLPAQLAVPTLAALSRLAERYGVTVVLSTATQPAFSHLHEKVRELCVSGWQPREIVPAELNLFDRARRTRVHWPTLGDQIPWGELVGQLASHEQVLCVVNVKRHAAQLINMLKDTGATPLFHLSTSMCPAHRKKVLTTVRALLAQGRPCRLVSTQCVEAGVDVDFPVVYRAWGPLEAIAQAAGRCNRNGNRQHGDVHVFLPQQDDRRIYPDAAYEQAADVARMLLNTRDAEGLDIDDPSLFSVYYRCLYDLTKPDQASMARELHEAICRRDFVNVADQYRLISQDAISILVPYDLEAYRRLREEVEASHLTADWVRRARPHTVSIFRPKLDAAIHLYMTPVPLARGECSDDWFIYLREEDYDRDLLGLVTPQWPDALIG
jgi:CRISPR-associated endonuclease/helicase Cas3